MQHTSTSSPARVCVCVEGLIDREYSLCVTGVCVCVAQWPSTHIHRVQCEEGAWSLRIYYTHCCPLCPRSRPSNGHRPVCSLLVSREEDVNVAMGLTEDGCNGVWRRGQ